MTTTMEQRERFERLYHTTTQHLLVRDFTAAKQSVLALLDSSLPDTTTQAKPTEDDDEQASFTACLSTLPSSRVQAWAQVPDDRIKAYKLYTFVLASKYEAGLAAHPDRPRPPQSLLDQVLEAYRRSNSDHSEHGSRHSDNDDTCAILHPAVLQTVLLSLLKINSIYPTAYSDALPPSIRKSHPLSLARQAVEVWLTGLDESTVQLLSRPRRTIRQVMSQDSTHIPKRSTEYAWQALTTTLTTSLAKSYRAILKVYVLEVLPRYEDWETSRDMIIGGLFPRVDEQESLLKKLHTLEMQHKAQVDARTQAHLVHARDSSANSLTSSVSSIGSSSVLSESTSSLEPPYISRSSSHDPHHPSTVKAPTSTISVRSAQTDKTIRPVDFIAPAGQSFRKGSGHIGGRSSGSGGGGDDTATAKESREDARSVGTPRSVESKSSITRHGQYAFEALRQRIARYLDAPLDDSQDHVGSSSGGGGARPTAEDEQDYAAQHKRLSISRRRASRSSNSGGAGGSAGGGSGEANDDHHHRLVATPLHTRIRRNPLFRLLIRLLSVGSILYVLVWIVQLRLAARRARRWGKQRAVTTATTSPGGTATTTGWVQAAKDRVDGLLVKIGEVIRMGTTITYV